MNIMEIIQFTLVIAVIGLFTWLIVHLVDKADRKKRMEVKRTGLSAILNKAQKDGFTSSQTVISPNGAVCFALDAIRKTFLLAYNGSESYFIYPFTDLLNYNLIQDGCASGNGAAVIGAGLLFGTIGAVAMASSSANSVKKCSDLRVELSVNDPRAPRHTMRFITCSVKTDSVFYRRSIECARQSLSILDYIKANADRASPEAGNNKPAIEESSQDSYDQVRQLFLLKEQGAITEQEYQERKDSLLDV